jgi:hypothetical protein
MIVERWQETEWDLDHYDRVGTKHTVGLEKRV